MTGGTRLSVDRTPPVPTLISAPNAAGRLVDPLQKTSTFLLAVSLDQLLDARNPCHGIVSGRSLGQCTGDEYAVLSSIGQRRAIAAVILVSSRDGCS